MGRCRRDDWCRRVVRHVAPARRCRVMIRRILEWTNRRLGGTSFTRKTLNKVFPDHWSFMLGEVALYCFVVLVATGTYLALLFHPGMNDVVYTGRYGQLVGVHMSEAYHSTVRLSFDVRAGLL